MKIRYEWEVSDIAPGKQVLFTGVSPRTIVSANFNDDRGQVFILLQESYWISGEFRTAEEMAAFLNENEGVPLP